MGYKLRCGRTLKKSPQQAFCFWAQDPSKKICPLGIQIILGSMLSLRNIHAIGSLERKILSLLRGKCLGYGLSLFLVVKLGFVNTSQGDGVTPFASSRRKFQLLALSLFSPVLQRLGSECHQYVIRLVQKCLQFL